MGDDSGRPSNSQGNVDWGRAVQTLISKGHRLDDIKRYTLKQVVSFYEAIVEEKIEAIKQEVTVQAVAMSGDGKQIKKFIDGLDGKPPEMMKIERVK